MLQQETISFLTDLAHNNNKPWFDANRDRYQAAKDDFEQFITSVLAASAPLDTNLPNQKAKDCIFRIFRDVRFGKDKTPYKANFGAFFSKGGKKYPGAGYYMHLEPGGKSFIGGGLWMPETPMLKAIRQEIDYNFAEFKGIIEQKKFVELFQTISGEQVKTTPQGYSADNPAIEYLKMKSFTVGHNVITDKQLTDKHFLTSVMEVFTTMKPFVDFLNRGVAIGS